MAEWEKTDALFRFVQVRAPETTRLPLNKRLPSVRAYFRESPTALHAALRTAFGNHATATMLDLGRQFIASADRSPWNDSKFHGSRNATPKWFTALDDFLLASSDKPTVPEFEKKLIATLAGTSEFFIDDRIISKHFAIELDRLWRAVADSVVAVSIWPFATPESQAVLMRDIRVIGVLNQIVEAGWTPPQTTADKPATGLTDLITAERIHTSLIDGLVLLPPDVFPLPRHSLSTATLNTRSLGEKRSSLVAEHMRAKLVRASAELSNELAAEERDHLPTVSELGKRLSGSTIALLSTIKGSQNLTLPELIDDIEKRINAEPSIPLPQSESAPIAAMRILIGDQYDDRLRESLSPAEQGVLSGDWMASNLTRSPVIGDLHVVQQELLRYEAGEIADIQNILAKEKKVHIHEYKETQETETITTTEHEEERTHDNQTTDRLELSQESSRQAQSQASLEAGVTFSGQWGPVKVGANTQFSYATSSEESNRSASSFSHEVVDRSVERIKERRVEQRRALRRQELLDHNEHTLDNQTDKHVVGIYQWIDKVYEAATFNYGLRMMLDVTVPEPALYWQYATAIATANKVTAKPPPGLTIEETPGSTPVELTAEHVGTLISIDDLAKSYRVRGLKPPPPRWVTAGAKLAPDKPPPDDTAPDKLQGLQTKAADIKIPKGYTPRWYTGIVSLLFSAREHDKIDAKPVGGNQSDRDLYNKHWNNDLQTPTIYDHTFFGMNTLSVGPFVDELRPGVPATVTHTFREAQVDNSAWIGESGDVGQEGSIPIAISVVGSPTFTATVTVVCERSAEAFKAWQMEQYEAVVTAWETWNQEFELAVRSMANSASPSLSTNSALAGSIVTTELRRLFLEMLHVPLLGAAGAVDPYDLSVPTQPHPPTLHAEKAAQYGRQVQFVEQAFEWPQLTYRLYPYYWKPRTTWATAMVLQDADPAFAEFLRAGSARLVVPVRPGFEIAVCSHLGINPPLPWQAGKPAIVDKDPYLSIAEEIKSSQTNIDKAPQRIDTPWPVRLPTTLVKLKSDGELPVYRPPTLVAIQVSPSAPNVTNGQSTQFTATGTYADNSTANLTAQVTWTSSDNAVATISNADGSRGLADSAGVGSTNISATFGSIGGSTKLNVWASNP